MGLDIPDDTLLLEPRKMFDRCLVGIAHQGGINYAVYSRSKVIAALHRDGMSYEDAVEHYEFNVSGSIGIGFPIFMVDEDDG